MQSLHQLALAGSPAQAFSGRVWVECTLHDRQLRAVADGEAALPPRVIAFSFRMVASDLNNLAPIQQSPLLLNGGGRRLGPPDQDECRDTLEIVHPGDRAVMREAHV